MSNNDGPKAFGDNDITITIGQDGMFQIFAGQKRISWIQSATVSVDTNKPKPIVEVTFPRSLSKHLDVQIEENVRVLSQFSWVRIIKAS